MDVYWGEKQTLTKSKNYGLWETMEIIYPDPCIESSNCYIVSEKNNGMCFNLLTYVLKIKMT